MTDNEQKEYQILKSRNDKRKLQVKLYFSRRNVRFQIYKKFFEKNAKEADRKILSDALANL